MKAKSVSIVLRKKIDEWLDSIDDHDLRKDLRENTIVTGGCIASMLLGEKVNDYDLYFTNKDTALQVANYYVDKFLAIARQQDTVVPPISVKEDGDRVKVIVRSAGVAKIRVDRENTRFVEPNPNAQADIDPELMEEAMDDAVSVAEELISPLYYAPVYITSNAISLTDKIQIVVRFYGNATEIHKNYDFVHCTNYWKSSDGKLVLRKDALESLLARELKYVGSKYPICSMIRTRKFIRRGWNINAGQFLKIAYQISQLDLDDLGILEEQLIGVDMVYFTLLLDKIREAAEDESTPTRMSSEFLFDLIDKIF